MNKLAQFFKDEYNHCVTSRLEAMKYGLEYDIAGLEKTYTKTKSERIWFTLEMKRQQLVNVSARLAERRMRHG